MKQLTYPKTSRGSFVLLGLIIALSCFALGYIDHETKTFRDLLTPQNLTALFIYFLPTFLTSAFLHLYFQKRYSTISSLFLSLIIGVPLTFILVIVLLLAIRRLHHS